MTIAVLIQQLKILNKCRLLKNEDIHGFKKVCIVAYFNFPAIKWKGGWSGDADNYFIECVIYAFLIQMVVKPTRIKIGQARNILDLVFVNDVRLISYIEHDSPIGKCHHETLFFTLYIGIAKLKENDEEYVYIFIHDRPWGSYDTS